MSRILQAGVWSSLLAAGLGAQHAAAQDPAPASTEAALVSVFSPRRAPDVKTMGLLQRSFLDLLEESRPKLEVALVVDGTESMEAELDGIRRSLSQMVADLVRYKGSEVSFQLVVYRDVGAGEEVELPLRVAGGGFTRDTSLLEKAFVELQTGTGAPYFPELVDLGIHKALTELNWSDASDTTRWLLVFGDAPPFAERFEEADNQARRRVATEQLIATANRLDIRVNCVLCPTRPKDQAVYEQVLRDAQEFMSRVSTETGGLMLDLSFPDIRQALEEAAKPAPAEYQQISGITRQDVEAARQQKPPALDIEGQAGPARIAVLPHMPLEELDFDPSREAVQIATELRHRLRQIPGTELKSPVAIERRYEILRARGVRGPEMLQVLAQALDVDYIVWGAIARRQGTVQVQSAIYSGTDGRLLVEDSRREQELEINLMTGRLMRNLVNKAVSTNRDRRLTATFASLRGKTRPQTALVSAIAANPEARSELLIGFENLERALEFPVAAREGLDLLAAATTSLEQAVADDPANPLAQLLLANAYYNQFQALETQGQGPEAEKSHGNFESALRKAYAFRSQSDDFAYVRREIEADYALLISHEYPAAIAAYQELAGIDPETPLHTALRANWMLAGIHAGDWGLAVAAPDLVDPVKARQYLVKILAHWPDSDEAKFIRKNLRWDDEEGRSQFEHFPRLGQTQAGPVSEG